MKSLITPDEVPQWIPGSLILDSTPMGWQDAVLKGYRYDSLDVTIPSMRDYMIVRYKCPEAVMSRRAGGKWQRERVEQGVLSLLTCGESSQWMWDRPIEVTHLYLPQSEISRVACAVFERNVHEIGMNDCVRMEDRILTGLLCAYEAELHSGGLGGQLYRTALLNQLCIHLLRNYAQVKFKSVPQAGGRMAEWQKRRVLDFIAANLDRNLQLDEIAREAGTSISGLTRKFQLEYGCAPHAYVLRQRLERAQKLLRAGEDIPLKVVAADCGFSDQSHLVRHFKRAFNQTPMEYRRSGG